MDIQIEANDIGVQVFTWEEMEQSRDGVSCNPSDDGFGAVERNYSIE